MPIYSCPGYAEWKDLVSRDLLRGYHMELAQKSDAEILRNRESDHEQFDGCFDGH